MYIGKGYIALIHQYQNNGYNIVMDVYSGAVHVVDELCYDVIAKLSKENEAHTAKTLKEPCVLKGLKKELGQKYEEGEIEDALADVIELTEAGRLFAEDAYECMIEEVKKRKTVVKALCLHIAHDCNLACKYCFAEEGEYHGRRALMSFEVGKKALDFLIANSGNRHNLEVDFFGGEPLMNWQVVKDLVAYGREQEKIHDKHFRFTITTNGVLLNDEVQEFVNKEMDMSMSIANPTVFYGVYNSGGWKGSNSEVEDYWGGASGTKTNNDPCPAGYRVPTFDEINGFIKDIDTNKTAQENVSDQSYGRKYTVGDQTFMFPGSALRVWSAKMRYPGRVTFFWSSTISPTTEKKALDFYDYRWNTNADNTCCAMAVRCIKIQ